MDASILTFLAIALGLVIILKKAKINPFIAFVLAGIIAGPHALKLFEGAGAWNYLGELGMIFLWFTLGLELNIRRLWSMRKNIFGFGATQVILVAAFLFPFLFGLTTWTISGAVMVCLMLAMSGAGANLQMLADRNELQSKLGRQTFSILLFQDLLAIPLLAMLPVFAGRSLNLGAEIIDVSIMTIGLIIGVVIAARMVMNPVLRAISKTKSREAFLIAILICIAGCGAVFYMIGMPAAIGAFLAGMLFSDTVYNHQVRADIAPYQMLFVGLFFIALGMGLDLGHLWKNIWIIAGGAAGLVAVKFAAIFIAARIRGTSNRQGFLIALILAQGGEFGLLLLQTIKIGGIGVLPAEHAEILTAVIILSMALSTLALSLYDKLNEKGLLYSLKKAYKYDSTAVRPHVLICGFGRVGMTIAKMLSLRGIPYIAIDMDVDRVADGRDAGFNAVYGDTTRGDILAQFGLAPRMTRAAIVALDNAAVAKKTVRAIRQIAPRVKIFARARNLSESKILISEGARVALPETIESSFLLGHGVLAEMGASEREIKSIMSKMRGNDYEVISGILAR